MTNKIKILALFGKAGSGKDTILKWINANYSVNPIISCTTRPIRENEKDGLDYHFVTDKEFTEMVLNNKMLEATCFRNWFYGTPIDSLVEDKINIGVFNIGGIETLLEDDRLEVIPIYIDASAKQRLMRCLSREENPDCDEIVRRYGTDEKDFRNIEFKYEYFLNEDWNTKLIRSFFNNFIK